jgi:two-component response regulator ARR-A family
MDTIGPHVLIVDDTFVDRLVASRVLKTCNIQGIMS